MIQFFSAVVIGNVSASLDFEQQLLRKFRKLNLSIVKVRAKLVHVIFHYFVIWKTALHYNFKLLQSEHISAGAFTVNTAIFQDFRFNIASYMGIAGESLGNER